jgi:hypothetical protein
VKPSLASLAIMLLSVGAAACGGANKATGSASQASSNVATTAAQTTTASTSAKPTATTAPRSGGESSLDALNYGHEASEPDRRAITALVKRYYAAAAADDGATACSLIYSTFEEAIPEDYGQPPGPPNLRGKTCAVIMSKLFKQLPGEPPAVLAKTEVTGVSVRGRRGFARLHSSAMHTGSIAVERERQTWKIQALIGSACTTSCPPARRRQHG